MTKSFEDTLSAMVGKKVKRGAPAKKAVKKVVKKTTATKASKKAAAVPTEELVPDIQLSEHTGLIIGGAKSKGKKCIMLTRLYCTQRDPQWKYARGGMMIPRTELKALMQRMKDVATDPNTDYKDMDSE